MKNKTRTNPTQPVASLPMYDFKAVRKYTDIWWSGIAQQIRNSGLNAPQTLSRSTDEQQFWKSPNLLLSQSCATPLSNNFKNTLQYVATPVYNAKGCHKHTYTSLFIIRQNAPQTHIKQFHKTRFAFNRYDSFSGWDAMESHIAPYATMGRFFAYGIQTGSHAASLIAVKRALADICAIDCVTFALIKKYYPTLPLGLRILTQSAPAPGLPYVTAITRSQKEVEALYRALKNACKDPKLKEAKDALLLKSIAFCSNRPYDLIGKKKNTHIRQTPPMRKTLRVKNIPDTIQYNQSIA